MTNQGSYNPAKMTACPPELRQAMRELGDELKRNRLDVVLAPAPYGDSCRKIRVVQGESPEWYQRLCRQNPSAVMRSPTRLWYTKISRYDIARQIHLLATQGWSVSKYAPFLVAEALEWQRQVRDKA